MLKKILSMMSLTLGVVSLYGWPLAARNGRDILSTRIEGFHISSEDISIPLQRLSADYEIPIGLEALGDTHKIKKRPTVHISIDKGTARDAIIAIIATDPRYTWKESKGVVNVFPRIRHQALPDVGVNQYVVNHVDRDEAISRLIDSDEVQHWIEQGGVRRRDFVGVASQSVVRSEPFSITLSKAPVREILNAILTASGSHYWVYSQYGDHSQFFSLAMTD